MVRSTRRSPADKWSQNVTEHSERRKSSPYRSAMSMLTFYINRAGDQLPQTQRARLEAAKGELRALFGVPAANRTTGRR